MSHHAIAVGNIALITGGASGIGLAAAKKFAALGLKIVIVDVVPDRLETARAEIIACAPWAEVQAIECDVSDRAALLRLERSVRNSFGTPDIVMNNAGIQPGSAIFSIPSLWEKIVAINLMGIVHGTQVFAPTMIAKGTPGLIINTGSKQGITTPPGDPAYNVAKAGVKAFTEALQHELRNMPGCAVSAHLLIPGFVFTGLTAKDRTEKPAAAWTPEQTIDFMLESLERGDFYILCPDNDVPRPMDEKRIAWAAGDIIANRPALSRWHPDHADAFKQFTEAGISIPNA